MEKRYDSKMCERVNEGMRVRCLSAGGCQVAALHSDATHGVLCSWSGRGCSERYTFKPLICRAAGSKLECKLKYELVIQRPLFKCKVASVFHDLVHSDR